MEMKFRPKRTVLPQGDVEVVVKNFKDGATFEQDGELVETCVVILQTDNQVTIKGYFTPEWHEGSLLYSFVEAVEEDMTKVNENNLDLEKYIGRKLKVNVQHKKVNGLTKIKVVAYMKLQDNEEVN